jgi:hypothetical protein
MTKRHAMAILPAAIQRGFLMRWLFVAVPCVAVTFVAAQEPAKLNKRYGLDVNLNSYPQKTPQEALLSIGKAVENKRMDYLMAHLADPRFVDESVANYQSVMTKGGDKAKRFLAFDRLVSETTQYFLEDPTLIRELRRFGKEAEWETMDNQAVGTLKAIQGRKVFLRKHEDRWFLENRQQ